MMFQARPKLAQSWAPPFSRCPLYLDCQMRERLEARKPGSIVGLASCARRDHRHDRAEMTGPEAPEMQIGDSVALAFDR